MHSERCYNLEKELSMGKLSAKPVKTKVRSKPALSIEELARQQHVKPAHDLDALGALWPMDDEPDRLLQFILGERQKRRRLREGN
jgi:hypothetical protein